MQMRQYNYTNLKEKALHTSALVITNDSWSTGMSFSWSSEKKSPCAIYLILYKYNAALKEIFL